MTAKSAEQVAAENAALEKLKKEEEMKAQIAANEKAKAEKAAAKAKAKEEKAAAKASAKAEKEKAKAEKAAAKEAAKTGSSKVQQNGITRPKSGSKCERIWLIADELSATLGSPVPRKDVVAKATLEGLNDATIATQYGRWREFNGLKGVRIVTPKPAAEVKPAEAPAAAPA